MHNYIRFIGVVLLFFLLIFVRAFATKMFYDPFINYFKDAYLHQEIPVFNHFKLYFHIFLRYLLNSVISLGVIYLLFQKHFLRFSIKFYAVAFFILLVLFILLIEFRLFKSYLPLFYLRRFLIHPIFILLLIPIFYYQKKNA